jgi:hypothetical protein
MIPASLVPHIFLSSKSIADGAHRIAACLGLAFVAAALEEGPTEVGSVIQASRVLCDRRLVTRIAMTMPPAWWLLGI